MSVESQFLRFVFYAYSAVFILIFLYITSIWRRARRLDQTLEALGEDSDKGGS